MIAGTNILQQLQSVIAAAANALQRSNHLGTQPFATLTGLPTTLSGYGITDGATDSELAAHAGITNAHGASPFGRCL